MIVLELPIFLVLMLVMYIEILPSVIHCLCMVPSLLVLVHNFFMIIVFFIYYQFTTLSHMILVQSTSDCGTCIIHNSLLFIDTLYFRYLHLCILYVCINSKSTVFTALSILVPLPASACI